jgi:hypothetical protein
MGVDFEIQEPRGAAEQLRAFAARALRAADANARLR